MRLTLPIVLAVLCSDVIAVSSKNQSSIDPDLVVPVPNGAGLSMNAFKLIDSSRPECSDTSSTRVACLKWISIGYPRVIAFVMPSLSNFLRYFHVNQQGVSIDVQILDEEQKMQFAGAATRLYGEKVSSEQIRRAKLANVTCSLLLDSELITGTASDLDSFPIRVEFRSMKLRNYIADTLEKTSANNAYQKIRLQCSIQALDLLQASTALQVNATELRELVSEESNVTYITTAQMHGLFTRLYGLYRNSDGQMSETRFNNLIQTALHSAGILGQFENLDFSTAFRSLSSFGMILCASTPKPIKCSEQTAVSDLESLFEIFRDESNQPRIRYVRKAGNNLASLRLSEEENFMLLYLDVISIGNKDSIAALGNSAQDSLTADLKNLNDVNYSDVQWVASPHLRVASLKCAKYNLSNLPTRINFPNIRYKYPVSFTLEFSPILQYTSRDTPENLTSQLQSQLNRVDDRLRNLTSLFVSVDTKLTETKNVYDFELLRDRFVEDASCSANRFNINMTCAAECLQNPDCSGFYAKARNNTAPGCLMINNKQNSSCPESCCKLTKVASEEKWKQEVIGGNQRLISAMNSLDDALRAVATSPVSEDSLVTNIPCARLSGSPSCYYFSLGTADWNGAEQACRQMGMHLVTIDNALEQAAIESYVKFTWSSLWWIGLQVDADGKGGAWSSGRPYVYSNFHHNATTSTSSERRCVTLEKAYQYSWTMHTCTYTGWYLCEAALSPNSLS